MNRVLVPAHMVNIVSEIDATHLHERRQNAKQRGRTAPSYTALVIKAAALTMQRNPEANRAILGLPPFRKLVQFSNTDISVAVEKSLPYMPGQAYAEPMQNPAERSLEGITESLRELSLCDESNNARFRMFMRVLRFVPRPLSNWLINLPYHSARLWQRYRGCACWVNAPSKAGADLVMTTWPWPITFSFGVVKKRAFVVDDEVTARITMPIIMVFDRRIMGGGPAGRVFAQFSDILENEVAKL